MLNLGMTEDCTTGTWAGRPLWPSRIFPGLSVIAGPWRDLGSSQLELSETIPGKSLRAAQT